MMYKDELTATALRCWAELRLPARIPSEKVAEILGVTGDDVTLLLADGFLKPLGKPAPNGPKWFASVEIILLAAAPDRLSEMTKRLSEYWKRKHAKAQRAAARNLERPATHKRSKQPSPDSSPDSSLGGQLTGSKSAVGGQ